jgi:ParB family chromosome partitioning protein
MSDGMRIETLHVSKIRANKHQPRKTMDAEKLAELQENIKAVGIIDPIMVRPVEGGYEIIKGHRRFEALTASGKKMVTVLVKEGVTDDRSAVEALMSNEFFEAMDPFDRAAALRKLQKQLGLKTERQLAEFLGMNPHSVQVALQYERVVPEVREKVSAETIGERSARSIGTLPAKDQLPVAEVVTKQALTHREVDRLVPAIKKAPAPIKRAILEQMVDAKDAIEIMENEIPEDMAEAVVEELEERKARRDAHNAIEKEADAATLSGRMTPTQFKRLKSEDEKAYDRVMSWKDQFFIQPVSLVYDIQDDALRQSAMKALGSVIDKASTMVRKAQVKDGYEIPAEDLEAYR